VTGTYLPDYTVSQIVISQTTFRHK